MKYELIQIKSYDAKNNVALILRGNKYKEYAVVRNLDRSLPEESDEQWSHTIVYYDSSIEGLTKALDYFRYTVEDNYIPRVRLEELATLFKDGLMEDDREEALEYFDNVCDMEPYEFEFFGIECNNED